MIKYSIQKCDSKKFKEIYLSYKSKQVYPNSYICLAKYKTKIIGHLIFRKFFEFPNIWALEHISVLDNYKRQGIGTHIISKIVNFIIKKKGIKILVFVSKTNTTAQSFYKNNNFKKEAEIKKMKLNKESLYIYTKEI